jgi:hypothetical protein
MTASSRHKKHAKVSEKRDKKEKKSVSTNVIFKSGHDRSRKDVKKSSPEREKNHLGKSVLTSRHQPLSSPPLKRKLTLAESSNGMSTILYLFLILDSLASCSAALDDYKKHVSSASDETIDHVYNNLIQQLETTTLSPTSLRNQIMHADKVAQTMCAPLDNEQVEVTFKDQLGNLLRTENAPIGDTVQNLASTLQEQKYQIQKLWQDWDDVRQQIAETGARILRDQNFPAQFGLENVADQFTSPSQSNAEVEDLRREIKNETKRAYKELDQEAKDSVDAHKEYQTRWLMRLQANLM